MVVVSEMPEVICGAEFFENGFGEKTLIKRSSSFFNGLKLKRRTS
jgi:hypothetical protein